MQFLAENIGGLKLTCFALLQFHSLSVSPSLSLSIQRISDVHHICRFHVDKMSSAHVYVRLHKGQTIDDISDGVLEDCAQLVKANSIQGIMNITLSFIIIRILPMCMCGLLFLVVF